MSNPPARSKAIGTRITGKPPVLVSEDECSAALHAFTASSSNPILEISSLCFNTVLHLDRITSPHD
jgi:hypothetical protein